MLKSIIPLSLIQQFFEKWLTGLSDSSMHQDFNNCVNTLYGRLKQSMQKVILAVIKSLENIFENDRLEIGAVIESRGSDNIFTDIFSYTDSWLRGNIFLGPRNRGPFDPRFDRNEEDSNNAFEEDAAPIIGQSRHNQLRNLFNGLHEFIDSTSYLPPIWRLLNGFDYFVEIVYLMINENITPENDQQWELRLPREEDLRNVQLEEMRRLLSNQSFWDIKKSHKKHLRSTSDFKIETEDTPQKLLIQDLRYKWSKFVADLMTVSMDAHYKGESLTWSCYFTRVYNDYLFDKMMSTKAASIRNNCPICFGFNEYLYKKISRSRDWVRCNKETEISSSWCMAWKRIVNSDGRMKYNSESKENVIGNPIFTRDVETFMRWLMSKIQVTQCEKSEPTLPTFQHDPLNSGNREWTVLDNAFCFLSNTLTFWTDECKNALSKR